MKNDFTPFKWILLFISVSLLALLRIDERHLIQGNALAIDLISRKLTGEEVLDIERANKVSETLLSSHELLAANWSCEYGNLHICDKGYQHIQGASPTGQMEAFYLAGYLSEHGREGEAIQLWRQAESGRYWAFLGRTQPGCACQNPNDGLCLLRRAVAISPEDGIAQYLLGERLSDCGQWAEAITPLSVAVESGDLIRIELFNALIDRGIAAYQAGRGLAPAEADISQAARLQPNNPWPWLRLSLLYSQDGRYYEAAELCTQAIQLAPELGYAYYYRGRALQAASALDQAITDYERALKLDPTLTVAIERLNRIRAAE